jgi:uncharacterized protein (TIGR02466 family)
VSKSPDLVGEALLFATPVISFMLPDAATLNHMLMREIMVRRTGETGVQRSNRGGWHSADDFFRRDEPAHRMLAESLLAATRAATLRFQADAPLETLALEAEGWINVSQAGALNAPHAHPGWLWSGTYYVQVSELSGTSPTDGCIEFLDSRTNLRVLSVVDMPFMRGKAQVRPVPGLLVLFPSHLLHWVYPFEGAGERVSIAFNARWNQARAAAGPR